ncbi:ogr/Delta-like zinc finger family protein [Chromobacterium subtsugae]|uniref:ogr/Delta-like zinc finger family protein n=1 Tax=Chromobacterium subtsugae TaxID=251747 RepID=UPI000AAA58AD|nr:ogr/Delta-like zinc finger family protein [Chromobacterium subtsugae]
MAFPCPLCGAMSRVRTSRMLTASTKEIYYNCSNDDCCHQYKTMEGEPRTVAQPIKGGAQIPPERLRKLPSAAQAPAPQALTITPGRIQHRVLE